MDSLFFHPKIVHFPIALGVLMPLFIAGGLLAWHKGWLPRRHWWAVVALQSLLFGSALAAEKSGENEEDIVETVVSHEAIHEHEEWAERAVRSSLVTLLLMIGVGAAGERKAAKPLAVVALLASGVTTFAIAETGEHGGELVYEHGAAQAYTGIVTPIDHDEPSESAGEDTHGERGDAHD